MASLADSIEEYIKVLIKQNGRDMIEITRRELANRFDCVPSQINYVLDTRFTVEKGYIIESRRGGGGYIRIIKVNDGQKKGTVYRLLEGFKDRLTQHEAERVIEFLYDQNLIGDREKILLRSAVNRKTIGLKLPLRDRVRARLLRNMLVALFNL